MGGEAFTEIGAKKVQNDFSLLYICVRAYILGRERHHVGRIQQVRGELTQNGNAGAEKCPPFMGMGRSW